MIFLIIVNMKNLKAYTQTEMVQKNVLFAGYHMIFTILKNYWT